MGKLQLKIDGNDFTGVLADNPVIKDQLNACCRTLTFKLSLYGNRLDLLAHKVELFYNGKRWFIGEDKKAERGTRRNKQYNRIRPTFFVWEA